MKKRACMIEIRSRKATGRRAAERCRGEGPAVQARALEPHPLQEDGRLHASHTPSCEIMLALHPTRQFLVISLRPSLASVTRVALCPVNPERGGSSASQPQTPVVQPLWSASEPCSGQRGPGLWASVWLPVQTPSASAPAHQASRTPPVSESHVCRGSQSWGFAQALQGQEGSPTPRP